MYTVPSGTALTVRISQDLSSKTSNVGDVFRGSLAQSVRVQGVTVLKAGAPVSGTVVAARKQGRFKGEGDLGIELSRVGSYEVTTQEYEQTVKGKGKRTGAMVGGGAGGGALIGWLAGGGKGALIGGLVGAGAGTAGAALTGNKGVAIAAESVVTFISSSPITVTLKPKSTVPSRRPLIALIGVNDGRLYETGMHSIGLRRHLIPRSGIDSRDHMKPGPLLLIEIRPVRKCVSFFTVAIF